MTDFNNDKGTPGGWGEYFAAVSGLSVMMQSGKYRNYDEVLAAVNALNASTNNKYSALATLINEHINNQNNSDHKLNSLDVDKGLVGNVNTAEPTQTGTDFDELFTTPSNANEYVSLVPGFKTNSNIHKQNLNPISTYGDKTWLPVNVTNDYAGATAVSAHSPEVNMVEDNSTYIGLHAGTNGVSRGVYYHYLVDAARRDDQTAVMSMHHKYTPKGLTSGNVVSLISTDGKCIIGRIAGNAATAFVSIVNGDINPANHKTAFITLPFGEAYDTFSTACVAGDYVYVFRGPLNTAGNTDKALATPHEFFVYRIRISAMVEGGNAVMEPVTGWATTGLYGLYNGNTIRLANRMASANVADRPLMLHNNAGWLYSLDPLNCNLRVRAEVHPDDDTQIRLAIHHTARATTVDGTTSYGFMAYSLLLSVAGGVGNTATMEDNGGGVTVSSGDVKSVSLSSSSMVNPRNVTGVDKLVGWANACTTRSGYVLTRFNDLVKNNNTIYTKSKIVGFVNKFMSLRYKTLSLHTVVSSTIAVDTETDFTTNIINPRSLPAGYVMMNGLGRSYPSQGNYTRGKRVSVPGSPTTNYPTVNSGTLLGWINSTGVSDYSTNLTFNQCIFISRSNSASATITCDASVMYRGGKGGGVSLDINNTVSGTFTYTSSEAENTVYNALRLITGRDDIFQYDWVVYVPQDASMPVSVVAGYTAPNGSGYMGGHVLFELTYAGSRTGNITGYTYKKLCKHVTYGNVGKEVWLDVESMAGIHSYKTSDNDYLDAIGCPVVIKGLTTDASIIGLRRDHGIVFYAAVSNSAVGTYVSSTVKSDTHDNYPGGVTPGGIANSTIGLGKVNYVKNNLNYNTLMIVNSMALNYTQFVAWNTLNEYVMTSQKKSSTTSFKFYCDEPVFIAGREYTMGKKVISLTTVTPTPNGKVFYVGVSLNDSVAEYDVSLTAKDASISFMPLGTISVDNNGVSTFLLRKPIRLDVYELQTYRRGTGIPHTVGSAIDKGQFYWLDERFNGITFTYYDTNGVAHATYDTSYNISYILMRYDLKAAINNVTVTLEEITGPDEDRFLFKLPGGVWETKTLSLITNTVAVGATLRIDVHVHDDYNVARRITSGLKVKITYGQAQYIKNTDTIGYTLTRLTSVQVTKHIVSGTLAARATARIKLGGGGNNFAWDQAPIQHGGTGFPSGSAPNGLSITMPLIYDNRRGVTVVTPLIDNGVTPEQYVFERAGTASTNNVTSCALNMDVGDNVYAKVITPSPANGLPWFANAGPIVELNNWGTTPATFRLLVGNIVGAAPPSTTKLLDTWSLEHTPPWYFNNDRIFNFSMRIDDSGYFDIDFRTGVVTIAINNDRRSTTGNVVHYPDGAVWAPGLQGGGFEDYHNYVTAARQYPDITFGNNLASISTLSVRVGEKSGRNQLYVQRQPTAANGYVARIWVGDGDDGPGSYSANIYLTATNAAYTGVLRNVDLTLTSVTAGPVSIHPADSTWNIRVVNRSTTNITNMPIDITLNPATSSDANNLTLSNVKAANGSDPVYTVVTAKTVTVSVAAGATVVVPVPVYGNSVLIDGVARYSQYNIDANIIATMRYGSEEETVLTPNQHVEYIDRTADMDVALISVQQPSASSANTAWSFEVSNTSGEDLLGVQVTYERIVTPTSAVNEGLTFSTNHPIIIAEGVFHNNVVKTNTMAFNIGASSITHDFTLYGNSRYADNSGTLVPVDDKYDVDLGMKITIAYGGKSRTFTIANSIHIKTT